MAHENSGAAAGEHDRGRGWSGLTLTTGAFLFLLLRLFAVSDYQWHTAFAVLHTLDLEDSIGIVLGTVMADSVAAAVLLSVLLPAFLFRVLGGLVLAARLRRGQRSGGARGPAGDPGGPYASAQDPAGGRRPDRQRADLSGLVMLALVVAGVVAYATSFHAWWLLLVSAAVTAAAVGVGLLARRGRGQVGEASRWAGRHLAGLVVALAIIGLLVSAAVVRTPWMPLERVAVEGAAEPLVGYVLEAEPGFLKFLTADDREFLILNDQDVASRTELVAH
ncbi:hypothetical protein ACQPZG_23900 [Streptomyces sp. CA-294286]|uniref:hypothetical protein n=1 Tax=Streptomyces sp. CA-294286 TaxID=3240070 RepID=UPI003D8AB8EE